MAQPILQYRLDWTPYHNYSGKLSSANEFVNPITGELVKPGMVDLILTTNEYLEKIYVTVVKDGDDYGFIDDELVDLKTGVLVIDFEKRTAMTTSVTLNVSKHFIKGGGQYRIGLYAQNIEGFWNYEYYFITINNEEFDTVDNETFMVPVWTE